MYVSEKRFHLASSSRKVQTIFCGCVKNWPSGTHSRIRMHRLKVPFRRVHHNLKKKKKKEKVFKILRKLYHIEPMSKTMDICYMSVGYISRLVDGADVCSRGHVVKKVER